MSAIADMSINSIIGVIGMLISIGGAWCVAHYRLGAYEKGLTVLSNEVKEKCAKLDARITAAFAKIDTHNVDIRRMDDRVNILGELVSPDKVHAHITETVSFRTKTDLIMDMTEKRVSTLEDMVHKYVVMLDK
jgi:hypothetical protein